MAIPDLLKLLKHPEGKKLEVKRDLSSPDGVLKTVVAFANTAGGIVLIGIEDRSGNVCGVADPLDEEARLANLISDRISPRIAPAIEIQPWRQTHVLALQVYPSPSRPYHLTNEGPSAGVYVRVGSTNRRADPDLIEELRRYSRGESFDEQPMPALSSEALDFRAASESFASIRVLAQRELETLRLVSSHQGRAVPTVGGIILFGHEREHHFPDAWIQAGRFGGIDRSRILDGIEVHSIPVQAVEEAIAFVQKHSLHSAYIGAVYRTDNWIPPPQAVREALINAVVHTDYSQRGAPIRVSIFNDRLEILLLRSVSLLPPSGTAALEV